MAYKFWHGDKSFIGNHIVNQPCVRHWDIEKTGDRKHLSFFNMFVASSIGGFSRKEEVSHFYDFFTKCLNLDPSRFYASYFGGGNVKDSFFPPDNEMKKIWESVGIDKTKIIAFSGEHAMEAFVANSIEPVGGPRAELFYDLRDQRTPISSTKEFLELDSQGKILEFCTNVLYNLEVKTDKSKGQFSFRNMDSEALATGFGPQRILTILENADCVGDISIIKSLRECLGADSGPEQKKSAIICADHIRGIVFLINDGALDLHGQRNRGRRYIFRHYFKNFRENFERIPLPDKKAALSCLAEKSIKMFGALFPEFFQKEAFIKEKLLELYEASA